jgi:hypothetical protein
MRLINPLWGDICYMAGISDGYVAANVRNKKLTLSQGIDLIMYRDDVDRETAENHLKDYI